MENLETIKIITDIANDYFKTDNIIFLENDIDNSNKDNGLDFTVIFNESTAFHIDKLKFDNLMKGALQSALPVSLQGVVAGFSLDTLMVAIACSAFNYATNHAKFLQAEDVTVIATFLKHSKKQTISLDTLLEKLKMINASHDWMSNIDSLTGEKMILKKEIDGTRINIKQTDTIKKIRMELPL